MPEAVAVTPAASPAPVVPATPVTAAPASAPAPDQRAADLTERLAAAARKESRGREQEVRLRTQEEALKARATEYETTKAELAAARKTMERLKQSPSSVLREHLGEGYYDAVTKDHLADGKVGPEQIQKLIDDRLEKDRVAAEAKARESAIQQQASQKKQLDDARATYQKEVETVLSSSADKYELTSLSGGASLVLEEVERHFNETGRSLAPDEALLQIEDRMKKDLKNVLLSTKYGKQILSEVQMTPPEKKEEAPAAGSPFSRPGLTNAATSATPAPKPTVASTPEERLARATKIAQDRRAV